jgi:hypothetical protein
MKLIKAGFDINDIHEAFQCECQDIDHIFTWTYFQPVPKEEDVAYLHIHLHNWRRGRQRIPIAIKYFLSNKPDHDMFCGNSLLWTEMDKFIRVLSAQTDEVDKNCKIVALESESDCCILEFEQTQDIINDDDDWAIIEFRANLFLKPQKNIWRRLWMSLKYVWGFKSCFGAEDEFVISKEAAKGIKNLALNFKALSDQADIDEAERVREFESKKTTEETKIDLGSIHG